MKPAYLMTDLELQEGFIQHFQRQTYRIEVGKPPYKLSSEFYILINGQKCAVGIYRHDKEADHYDT